MSDALFACHSPHLGLTAMKKPATLEEPAGLVGGKAGIPDEEKASGCLLGALLPAVASAGRRRSVLVADGAGADAQHPIQRAEAEQASQQQDDA